jgi:hypothetical protein
MANRIKYPLLFLSIGLLVLAGVGVGWWAIGRLHAAPVKLVLRGSSGRLKVSGGNLVVVTPRPGVFFGTVKKPDAAEQFTYVILFRYGRPKSNGAAARGHGVQFHCTSDARSAATTDAIDLDGRRIEAAYRVELDEAGTSVAAETLTVGGRRVDPAAGRVFLIDLAAEVPAYRQTTADLPPIPANLQTPADVERLADAIRQSLERQGAAFKAFLH